LSKRAELALALRARMHSLAVAAQNALRIMSRDREEAAPFASVVINEIQTHYTGRTDHSDRCILEL